MTFEQIISAKTQALAFDVQGPPTEILESDQSVELDLHESTLRSHGKEWLIMPADVDTQKRVDVMRTSGDGLFKIDMAEPEVVHVLAKWFGPKPAVTLDAPLEIGLDAQAFDKIRTGERARLSDEEVIAWLREEFVLYGHEQGPTTEVAVFQSGHEIKQRWGIGEAPVSNAADANRDFITPEGFTLNGSRKVLDVTFNNGRFLVERLAPSNSRLGSLSTRPVGLVKATSINFVNSTTAHQLRIQDASVLTKNAGYLDIWNSYHSAEKRYMLSNARRIRAFPYASAELDEGYWRFKLTQSPESDAEERWFIMKDTYGDDFELNAVKDLPSYLTVSSEVLSYDSGKGNRSWAGRVPETASGERMAPNWSRGVVWLEKTKRWSPSPPSSGYLILSIIGDKVRLDRREKALQKLHSSDLGIRSLTHLLNGLDRDSPQVNRRLNSRQRPLPGGRIITRGVQSVFGSNRPTLSQQDALEVALRTPDIALIQGPPGTGKTRIIAAIQKWLVEDSDSAVDVSRQILITGYQHDAVDNALSVTTNEGITAVRIGHRSGRQGFKSYIDEKKRKIIKYLNEKNCAGYSMPRHLLKETRILLSDMESGSLKRSALVDGISYILNHIQNSELCTRLSEFQLKGVLELIDDQTHDEGEFRGNLTWDLVRQLPTVDDLTAGNGWSELKRFSRLADRGELSFGEWEVLNKDIEARSLSKQSIDMLEILTSSSFVNNKLSEELIFKSWDALDLVIHDIERYLQAEGMSQVEDVLLDFINELSTTGASEFEDALKMYATSLAATCSQAGGNWIGKEFGDRQHLFDTVIIDEAARANPLDLLIPMVMANKRIILVGDQRQLPQMLEPEIEEEASKIEGPASNAEQKRRVSMFERLFGYLQSREDSGDICRCVTLDTQYRMHPVLGDFISDTFYPDISIKSGKNPSDFWHALPNYEGVCAAWLDVPRSKGSELPHWYRQSEIDHIVDEVDFLLQSPSSASLTFGIITFYSRQERSIRRALQDANILKNEHAVSDAQVTSDRYCGEVTPSRRLRVGTVDSFQGQEFDVVILSTVRSNEKALAQTEMQARQKFGFLTFENRLNVAMSRQKRLLIVCGDYQMFSASDGQKFVPGIYQFQKLTMGPHGRIL